MSQLHLIEIIVPVLVALITALATVVAAVVPFRIKILADNEALVARLRAEKEALEAKLRAEKEALEARLRAEKEALEAKLRAEKEAREVGFATSQKSQRVLESDVDQTENVLVTGKRDRYDRRKAGTGKRDRKAGQVRYWTGKRDGYDIVKLDRKVGQKLDRKAGDRKAGGPESGGPEAESGTGTILLNWAAAPTSERSSPGRGILISAHLSRATRGTIRPRPKRFAISFCHSGWPKRKAGQVRKRKAGQVRKRKAGQVRYWKRKAGQVRYWKCGQAEKPPDLAISDPSRFLPLRPASFRSASSTVSGPNAAELVSVA